MAKYSWTLTDLGEEVYLDSLSIDAENLDGNATAYSVSKRTMHGGRGDGVDVVEIDNGLFQFIVLPTRGMGLWRGSLGSLPIGWKSPVRGPVHPNYVPLEEASGLGWLEGFNELLCRCGLQSNGAPEFDEQGELLYPLHGKIANSPAHRVELEIDADSGEITLRGIVEETRFHFQKLELKTEYRTKVGESGVRCRDTITNLSAKRAEAQLLYHINIGEPLLQPGSSVHLPFKQIAPRNAHAASGLEHWSHYAAGEVDYQEQVYFFEPAANADGETATLLQSSDGTQGFSVHYNIKQLPYFCLWKNTVASEDGYVTGLEPGVNFPNPRTFEGEHNRVITLEGGESKTFEIGLQVHEGAESVSTTRQQIEEIQKKSQPVVHAQPVADWCAP